MAPPSSSDTDVNLRLLPWAADSGPRNMALDEALLDSALDGIASLRFYGWSQPTLTLGYFQSSATARASLPLRSLPWLRRHSGGAALVHHHELTYALALPSGRTWQPSGESWIPRMHNVVRQALSQRWGIETSLCERETKLGEVLCFLHHVPGDLLVEQGSPAQTCKIAGSAQRKRRGALLQHGGILLARSEFAPELPGLAELTGLIIDVEDLQQRLLDVLRGETGWQIESGEWTANELGSLSGRIEARYGDSIWNEKR